MFPGDGVKVVGFLQPFPGKLGVAFLGGMASGGECAALFGLNLSGHLHQIMEIVSQPNRKLVCLSD